MKKLSLVFALFLAAGIVSAQTEEVKPLEAKTELPQEASKGVKISEMATTLEGGKDKGTAISSAARRNSMKNAKAEKRAEKAERGTEASQKGKANRPANAARPANAVRPATAGPAAMPTPAVVKPVTPAAPVAPAPPVSPPAGNPGGRI